MTLFTPPAPSANYIPYVRSGRFLFVSGQTCYTEDGEMVAFGKLGGNVTLEQGVLAAKQCMVNLRFVAKAALGDFDARARVVRLGGFINSTSVFEQGPAVLEGASDLMVAGFGDCDRLARITLGLAALPGAAAV